MSKTCFKCGELKPLEQFYRHPQMADGHLNKCKVCTRKDVRLNRRAKRVYYNEYDVQRYRKQHRWPDRDPQKARATAMVNIRVQRGTMIRPKRCSQCGRSDLAIEAHHDDYSKPLTVRWLCTSCHDNHHAMENIPVPHVDHD
jgi:hypothetical protein